MAAAGEGSEAGALEAERTRERYRKLTPGPGRSATEVAEHQRVRIQGAMVEIVAERGYDAVRVRDLVGLAGVSSRTFYENFESKEDCFLRTYEMVTRGVAQRIIASQTLERDWRARPLLIFTALARELESEPEAGRFALIEAHAAGPAALEQVRRAERAFEAMLSESFARAPGGIVVPPLVVEGIVGGVAGVARARLLAGREAELPGLGDELLEWALSYTGTSTDALARLDSQPFSSNGELESLPPGSAGGKRALLPSGDRAMLLVSVAQLAVAIGYDKLTVTRIRTGAKVSRKSFDAHFGGVEDCFLAALEQKADEALARAAHAQAAGSTWPGGVYRGIAALCDRVAADPFLAMACLSNPFAEDSAGGRSRRRLIEALADRIAADTPLELQSTALGAEASRGALWALFHRHMVRDWVQQRQIAATLTFMALAPVIGAPAAVAAIRREQVS
jgi:AcrR family transcriptional regulator